MTPADAPALYLTRIPRRRLRRLRDWLREARLVAGDGRAVAVVATDGEGEDVAIIRASDLAGLLRQK